MKRDYRQADLTPRERALCEFATKLTREVNRMTSRDLEPLRAAGLTDAEIHDATQVIAYFNYINRIAEALGTDLEPGMPPKPR